MYTYQHIMSVMTEKISTSSIKRLPDGAVIPFDPANTDYQQYLKWLDEGGVVLPADEPNS
jgi:hypothetical protein